MSKFANDTTIKKAPPDDGFGILKFSAALAAATTLVLILLGFGVSLAVESKLLLPHASLFESSSELLDLGSLAIIEILPKIMKNMGEVATYLELMAQAWPSVAVLLVVYVIGSFILFYLKFIRKPTAKLGSKLAEWNTRFISLDPERRGFIKRFLIFLGAIFATLLFPIAVYFTLIYCMVGLCIVPVIGMVAGMAYIDDVAINNNPCAPLPSVRFHLDRKAAQEAQKSRNAAKPPEYAQCIKVLNEGKEVASGRLVLSTSKAVVLYLPNGLAKRVPLGDYLVEVVDHLPESTKENDAAALSETTAGGAAQDPN